MSNEEKCIAVEDGRDWPSGAVHQIEEPQRQIEMWRQLYPAELAKEKAAMPIVRVATVNGRSVVLETGAKTSGKIQDNLYPAFWPYGTAAAPAIP